MSSSAVPVGTNDTSSISNEASTALRPDSLSTGILLVLALTPAQRLIGFVRGILFCRILSPEELGHWDLAFSFMLLAAPLAVLGLPGSFGRYVEHYRQRGQLRTFLVRATLASIVLTTIASIGLLVGRSQISYLVFGDAAYGQLISVLALAMFAVIAFNFVVSLFTALRLTRIVARVQFLHSLLFAAIGLGLVYFWSPAAISVVVAYGAASLVAASAVGLVLSRVWSDTPPALDRVPQSAFWAKLMPFAAWIWATNLLVNLFTMADRYMIIHFGRWDSTVAAEMVGNYHSSRVVPVLFIAVAGMLAGLALPYLTRDWEAGERSALVGRMKLLVKALGVSLTCGGIVILIASPLLFGSLMAGKYDGGLAILPWTLIYCVWFSLCLASQNYLWCAERAKLVSVAYAIGLAGNVGLNVILLPSLGLLGAALATAISMALALTLILWFSFRQGMRWDGGVMLVVLLPLSLCLGPLPALAMLLALVGIGWGRPWFLCDAEKALIHDATARLREKLGWSSH